MFLPANDEMLRRCGNCVLHEQIVILFPYFKVLSKERRSRLKEWPWLSCFGNMFVSDGDVCATADDAAGAAGTARVRDVV
jgi:hypothetical protein